MPSLSLPFLNRKSPSETAQGFSPSVSVIGTGPYLYDRVKETSQTTGTGTLSLDGTGSLNFDKFVDSVGSGNSCLFEIVNRAANERETVLGTVTAGTPDLLSRQTVLRSSNGNALVNFSAGIKDVYGTIPAAIASPTNTNYNVKAFGAKGDVTLLTDGQMTSGSPLLNCPSGPFKSTDAGKFVSVKGPGIQGNNFGVANYLTGTILSYQSATQVTLSIIATITLSGCETYYGTDDSAAINAATLAASRATGGGIVYFPPGTYFVGTAINWYTHTHLIGSGIDTTILMLTPGGTNDIILSNGFASLTGRNTTGGIYGCSIRDITLTGYYYHGGFPHTQINAAALRSDTTLTVLDTTLLPSSGTLMVFDNLTNQPGEIISYTGKTATTVTGCTRALENTIPQTFQGGESVELRVDPFGVYQGGYGLRVYGRGYILENVMIRECNEDGFYSEWSSSVPELQPDGYQSKFIYVKSRRNNGSGIWFNGPHDSMFIQCQASGNSMNGIRVGPGTTAGGIGAVSGTKLLGCHSSGAQNYSFSLEGFCTMFNCIGEQAIGGQVYLNTSSTQISGCRFFASVASVFSRGIVMAGGINLCVIDATVTDCIGGSIDFTGDSGNNYIRLQIKQFGGGNIYVGTPNPQSNIVITNFPSNTIQLTGENSQANGPALFRSGQGTIQTLILRAPFNQSSNFIEAQLSAFPGAANLTSRFAVNQNGCVGINQGTPTFGLHQLGGSMKLSALGTPATPGGTAFGGSGTNVDYRIVAEDIAGNKSLVSAKVTISGGAALSASVWNRVNWTAVTGAIKYYILKTDTATQVGTFSPLIGGTISRVNVTAGGSGYTGSAPLIGFSGPTQCGPLFVATVAGNQVTAINPSSNNFGSGFTSVPNVVIGGPGNSAAATANMGVVNMTSIGAGGSAYVVGDEITLTGGTFATAAVLKATSVTAGAITAVAIKTMGSYSVLPANPVAQGSTDGAGTAGTFNISWGIASVTVTNAGTGYSSAPSIGFNGGGALPTSTAILAANAVSGISVLNGTIFWLNVPTIVIQGISAGSGATATAQTSNLLFDDVGQSTSVFTNPLRDATADITADGSLTASDLINTPYVSTNKEFMRHYETVTSAAATLATIAGIARTVTSAVAATNQKNARGEWLRISATTTGAVSSLVAATFTETQLQASPVFNTRVEIPTAIINMRVMIGFTSAAMVQTTDTQSTIHTLYFRYSTNTSDTKWQCCSSNASATTVIDSGITVVADTSYKLRIDCTDNTRIKFFINDTLVAVATATLPTASTALSIEHSLTSLTNTGQKDLDVAHSDIWQ